MNRPLDRETESLITLSALDALSIQFERDWQEGQSPRLEDYLQKVSVEDRGWLLRMLLSIELEQHRDADGQALTESQLMDAHPQLTGDLVIALKELRTLGSKRAGDERHTLRLPQREVEQKGTIDHAPVRKESRGLHIRCPHCCNAVELLADTPYEDVNCISCGSVFSLVDREEAAQMAEPLESIGRFDLISRLGVGGFGTVWKARDRELDRVVAIKMPRRGQLGPKEIEQFFREARAAAQLQHRHIVPVHEVGRQGETLFIVSDIVHGMALSDWLTGHRASPWEIAELLSKVADGLQHAHEKGVIHRDLKPSNIMIDEAGEPHLMDFGLAKRVVGEITMTIEGQVLGTPAYMSPEQARGESHWTDRRTDIYSMGVMLFEMLTQELPFRGNHQMQIYQRLKEDPPDPRNLVRQVPRDLSTICLKCMEREPGRRYSTAAELRDEFERFMKGKPILARPLSAPARGVRWTKRNPLLATTAALVTFLAVAGPLAALRINQQRGQLADLVGEKNNLIASLATEKQQDTAKIAALGEQLDLWEGRANPWEFWPPQPAAPPRRAVLENLFHHANLTLDKLQQAPNYNDEQRARDALSLALMADVLGKQPDAIARYREARDSLAALREQRPDAPAIARALAECDTALGRLTSDTDRGAAQIHLQSAQDTFQRLASVHPAEIEYQVDWLESELQSATLAGFAAGQKHLERVANINQALPTMLPNDGEGIYRLACFLTQHDALLATFADKSSSK